MALYPSPNPKPQYQETKPRIQANGGPRVVAELAGYCLAAGLALSTGILAVNYATPSRAVGLTQPATLAGKVSVSGISRSHGQSPGSNFQSQFAAAPSRASGLAQPGTPLKSLISTAPSRAAARSPGGTFSSQFAAAPSRAHGLAPGTLNAGVVNFNMGNGLALASARVPGATVTSLIPAALSRSNGLTQSGTLKSLIPSTLSRASSRTLPATLTALIPSALSRSNGLAAAAVLGGKVSLASTSRSHGLDTAQLSTHFPTTDIGGAIARDVARSRSTGIVTVGYATPSRAIARAGPATLRFVGAGFEMGSGIARMLGSRARATGIITVYYATPSRSHPFRAWAPIQLWYDAVPARAFGYARCAITLAMQGQQPPTISRSTGGRAVSVHLKLHYATVPSRCTPRAVAVLQFTGGTTQAVAGLSRANGKAHGLQLQTLSGPKIAMHGISRADGRARTASTPTLLMLYYVTPSKADPRAYGRLETYQDTGPSRGMGGRAFASLSSSLRMNVQGISRQTSRTRGAFLNVKPQLVGISLTSSRALAPAPNSTLPVSVAPSRDVARTYSGVLEFLPITVVDIGGGRGLATSRAVATLKTTNSAQPSIGTCRTPGAFLESQQPLASTSRETGLAIGQLALTGPSTIGLDGISCATSRTFGDTHISLAGGWIQGHGRAFGAAPSFALGLTGGTSLASPRVVAVLAFTGATIQPVSGTSLATSLVVLAEDIHHFVPAQFSAAHPLCIGELRTKAELAGTCMEHAVCLGAFDNPYQSSSRAHGVTQSGLLASALPLDGGTSIGTGRLVAELTIPREIPHLVFVAKHRVFVFIAKDRSFVIAAKERRFLFFAGGGQ